MWANGDNDVTWQEWVFARSFVLYGDGVNTPEADRRAHLMRLCEPILESNGIELVDGEWKSGRRNAMIRLYIHKPGGVTVGECQRMLRKLEPMLMVEGILDDNTAFEVASPGLDRPLRTPKDFRRADGYFVTVRRRHPDFPEKEERYVGKVTYVVDSELTLVLDNGEEVILPMDEIIEGKFDIRF